MGEQEQQRTGDVYREVKVGAVFAASRGPERLGLAPGIFVDEAGQKLNECYDSFWQQQSRLIA